MHEASLMADLVRTIVALAEQEQAEKVSAVRVTLGALAHLSPEHLREHFAHAVRGTVAESARLDIEALTDLMAPDAQELRLTSIDVESELR